MLIQANCSTFFRCSCGQSCTPNLLQKYWEKMCGLISCIHGVTFQKEKKATCLFWNFPTGKTCFLIRKKLQNTITKLLGLLKGYINHCDKLRGALQEFIQNSTIPSPKNKNGFVLKDFSATSCYCLSIDEVTFSKICAKKLVLLMVITILCTM